MIPPKVEDSCRVRRLFADLLLLCLFLFGPVSVGCGQDDQVGQLIERLKDPSAHLRADAAKALGEMKDARAVEPLIGALKDSEWRVVERAGEALEKIGAPAIEPLISALKDSKWMVRVYAAGALGGIGDARAVEPLIAALKDSKSSVRIFAAVALGNIGDARAVEPLIAALKDRNWGVRLRVAEALIRLGQPGSEGALIQALNAHGDLQMAEALLNCGNPMLEAAAGAWGRANGYDVKPLPASESPGVRWGRGR